MTNLQKWKDSLTVEEFVELAQHLSYCFMCPAKEACKNSKERCHAVVRQWAEQEVPE